MKLLVTITVFVILGAAVASGEEKRHSPLRKADRACYQGTYFGTQVAARFLDAPASVLGNLEVASVSGKLEERSDGVLPSPVAANPPGKLTFRILPGLRNRLS